MNKLYNIDAQGHILDELHGDVQPSATRIATEPSASLIRPRWDGKKWVESASNTERSQALTQHRRDCLGSLAAEAEAVRGVYYPIGPHALAVREQKLREARCVLTGSPKEEPILLSSEAAAAGSDVKTLAARVVEEHAAWCKTMGQIEAILRKYTDRLNKEKERATLTKVLEAGRAALWALIYGSPSAATAEVVEEVAHIEEGAVEEVKAVESLGTTGGIKPSREVSDAEIKAAEERAAAEVKAIATAEAAAITVKD